MPLLLALTPCVPISKREIARWPIVGSIARSFEVLFVDRDGTPVGFLPSAVRNLLRVVDALPTLAFDHETDRDRLDASCRQPAPHLA